MLLNLSEDHNHNLGFLTSVSTDIIKEFVRISIEFLKKVPNPKVYNTAAKKLEVSPETVKNTVESLMHLYRESAKINLNEEDFRSTIQSIGFNEDSQNVIVLFYSDNANELRKILRERTLDLPCYHDLDWRIDIQVASRSLRNQAEPKVLMKLKLKDDTNTTETHILQTDAVNLIHLTKTLESALEEMKTSHVKRILRNI